MSASRLSADTPRWAGRALVCPVRARLRLRFSRELVNTTNFVRLICHTAKRPTMSAYA